MKNLLSFLVLVLFANIINANQSFNPFGMYENEVNINSTRFQSQDKHFEKGMEYLKSKKYEDAIKEFDKSIKLNPENGNAYKQRGTAKAELVSQCSIYNAKREEGTPERKIPFDMNSANLINS